MRKKLAADKHLDDKLENAVLSYLVENKQNFVPFLKDLSVFLKKNCSRFHVQIVKANDSWTFESVKKALHEIREAPKTSLQAVAQLVVACMLERKQTWNVFFNALLTALYNVDHHGFKLIKIDGQHDWRVESVKDRKDTKVKIIPEAELEDAKYEGTIAALFKKCFPDHPLKFGKLLGRGTEGDVYDLNKTSVIKYASTYIDRSSQKHYGEGVRLNIRDVIKGVHSAVDSKAACVGKVFDFKLIGKFQVSDEHDKIKPEVYFAYFMISEKLEPVNWGKCMHVTLEEVYPEAHESAKDLSIVDCAIAFQHDESLAAIKKLDPDMYKRIEQFQACVDGINFNFKDLKLDNVMQNSEGVLKIIDFGTIDAD